MIYYVSSAGQVIGGTSGTDLAGITRLPSGADYAIYVPDSTVSSLNPNNLPGSYSFNGVTAGPVYSVPTATGTLVFTEQSAADQLSAAQQARYGYLEEQLQAQYNAGFSSSATGTAIAWPFDPQTQIKWNYLLSVIASGLFPASGVQVKDINGNVYTVTDETVAKNLCTDAMNFYLTWDSHYHTLYTDVGNVQLVNYATTQDAVNAVYTVTW